MSLRDALRALRPRKVEAKPVVLDPMTEAAGVVADALFRHKARIRNAALHLEDIGFTPFQTEVTVNEDDSVTWDRRHQFPWAEPITFRPGAIDTSDVPRWDR